MQPHRGPLTLAQKLEIITAHNNGSSLAGLSSDHSVDESVIECILTQSPRRRHLQLGNKLRLLHLLDIGFGPTELCAELEIFHSTIYRLNRNREKLVAMDKNRINVIEQRYLYAKQPVIEQYVTEFVEFARKQRLPVTETLIQERACMIAHNLGLEFFKVSNGWFSRYLRRSNVQSSCKLHGKGNGSIPTNHLAAWKKFEASLPNINSKISGIWMSQDFSI